MSTQDRLLGIFLTLLVTALGFGWGWLTRTIKEKDKKKGEWIDDGFYADGHSQHAYRCSECDEHYIGYVGEFKYCPNCGADMRPEPYKAER